MATSTIKNPNAMGALFFSSYKQMNNTTPVTFSTPASFSSNTYGLIIVAGQSSAAQPILSLFTVHGGSINTTNALHLGAVVASLSLSGQTLSVSSSSNYSRLMLISTYPWA